MLAVTRRKIIQELLQENKSVTITKLAAQLNVTKETIRRDLRSMEKDNELIRTHGGAYILEGVQNDIDISTRQVLRTSEKEIIAEKCNTIIHTGDIIFLDNSTTAWVIAQKIINRKLTVHTTSLQIANILSESSTIHLILIGGEYSPKSKGVEGDGALRNLERYFIDKAFISCRSVSMEYGITDINDNAALMHKLVLHHAKQTFLVVDHTKLNYPSFTCVAPVKFLTGIVLDQEFSSEWKDFLRHNNVLYY